MELWGCDNKYFSAVSRLSQVGKRQNLHIFHTFGTIRTGFRAIEVREGDPCWAPTSRTRFIHSRP
jgi:hypothetical protein